MGSLLISTAKDTETIIYCFGLDIQPRLVIIPSYFVAYIHPFILAFEPSYIEVRRIQSGEICQIIPTNNLRPLNIQQDHLHFVYDQYDLQAVAKVILTSEEEYLPDIFIKN